MAWSTGESIEDMMARLVQDELALFGKLGIVMYCPYKTPTRWERIKDDLLTFAGWR